MKSHYLIEIPLIAWLAPTLLALFTVEAFSDTILTGPTDSTVFSSKCKFMPSRMLTWFSIDDCTAEEDRT